MMIKRSFNFFFTLQIYVFVESLEEEDNFSEENW